MKILYWVDLFFPHVGGIETFSMDLIPALQSRGHEVTLLTSHFDDDLPAFEQMGSVPVHRFNTWKALRSNDIRGLMSIRKEISAFKKELNPDLVHLHFGATAYMHLQTQGAITLPTLTTVHALPASSLGENSTFSKIAHASQAVNAVSAVGLGILNRGFPGLTERFSYVYYGLGPSAHVDIEVIPPAFDEPVILCLGRMIPQKGFDLALKAFARVLPVFPKARLKMVGEGVEEAPLKQLANSLGIADKVEWTGLVPPEAVFGVMNTATMMLLPSLYEGLPLVALQAARMQRPMISSDVDGLPELVVDQKTGLVLKKNNEQELEKAILTFLNHPQQAIEMGRAAGQRLQERFAFDDCVAEYERLYRKIMPKNQWVV